MSLYTVTEPCVIGQLHYATVPSQPIEVDDELADRPRSRAGRHHDDTVAQRNGLVEVVGDEEHRLPFRRPQRQHLVLHQLPCLDVERRERFVHQDDVRVQRQHLGQRGGGQLPLPRSGGAGRGQGQLAGQRAQQPAALLGLEIKDRGIGIAPADAPHLFTPFFRSDRSRNRSTGGVGLGLVLSRRIVEAHGGTLTIESDLNAGTTARFLLPRHQALPGR